MVNNKRYVRVRDVDKAKLSELIVKAKGPSRSVRAFAEEIGVNPSTLTRLINMQNKSYSKDSLIIGIAEHADPASNVTLEMLMEAHGVREMTDVPALDYRAMFEKRMRQVILDELVIRGYTVQNALVDVPIGMSRYDMVLETDALGELGKWAFEFKAVTVNYAGLGSIRGWISSIMESFYVNNGKLKRISVVIENKDVFEDLRRCLCNYSIPDEFSVLYIGDNQVLDEFIVEKNNGVPVYVFKDNNTEVKKAEDTRSKLKEKC
ncbi:hypothetical protein [Anaerovibrio lipolyticus]|uniref:hypothetical protein n=1 Tax=Anaerovibrio lipolyticus TaxID=82374 RepID=UPI0026F1FC68|nr:hypothetical protein [Anaerovibrio lipolyticus]